MKCSSAGEKTLTEPKKNNPEQCFGSLVTEEEKVFVVAVLEM